MRNLGTPPTGGQPSFVARELDRISTRLRETSKGTKEHDRLYTVQQALAWALEPTGFMSPYDLIVGIQEGSADCRASSCPPAS